MNDVARKRLHALFDPIWQAAPDYYHRPVSLHHCRGVARSRCYCFVAHKMRLPESAVHISSLSTEAECNAFEQAIEGVNYGQVRDWWKNEGRKIFGPTGKALSKRDGMKRDWRVRMAAHGK
jgi:hypothetical protein